MPDQGILSTLWILGEECRSHADQIARSLGLTKAEIDGLVGLEAGQRITCRDMSERMGLSVSRGSRVIERLYRRGYISRADAEADRRCKEIRLTKPGEALRRRLMAELKFCEDRIASSMTEERIQALRGDLLSLIEALRGL